MTYEQLSYDLNGNLTSAKIVYPPTVTQSNATTNQVTLSWNTLPNTTTYYVYQNGTKIAETTDTSYTVSGLKSTDTIAYSFKVTALYTSGVESLPGAVNMLLAPSNIGTTNVTGTSFTLTWRSVAGATEYRVVNTTTSTPVTNFVTTNSISFTGLSNSTQYSFIVTAMNNQGSGFPSATNSFYTSNGGSLTPGDPCTTCASSVKPVTSATETQPSSSQATYSFTNAQLSPKETLKELAFGHIRNTREQILESLITY